MKRRIVLKHGLVTAALFLVVVASTSISTTKASVTLNSHSPEPNTVIVALEDGWYDQYMNAVPVLNQLGFKATFDVYTMGIGYGNPTWMNWNDINWLYKNGFDIESLTVNHLELTTMTQSQLNTQLVDSKNTFLQHGIQVGDLTLPYDTPSNDTVYAAAKEAGYVTVRGNSAVYDVANASSVASAGSTISINVAKMPVNVYYPTNSTTPSELNNLCKGSVSLLLYHHIDENASDPAAVSPAMFAEQMEMLKADGYNVETFSQAFFTETAYDSPLPTATATPQQPFANINLVGAAVLIVAAAVVAGAVGALAIRRRRRRNEN